jgi:hypothetical protein
MQRTSRNLPTCGASTMAKWRGSVQQTVEGPIEEKSKKPRLISAEGREIVGLAFSPKPVLGMEKLAGQRLGKEPEGYIGKRTVDPRMVPASRWCSPGLT